MKKPEAMLFDSQGFAAYWARKKAAEVKLLAEVNEAIRGGHDGVGQQGDELMSAQSEEAKE